MEDFIRNLLVRSGYDYVRPHLFQAARCLEQPIFSAQYPAGADLYGKDRKCDFILYHPARYPRALILESKWQQSSGSVDEKFPFLALTIKESRLDTIVVLGGGGYSAGAERWLRRPARIACCMSLTWSSCRLLATTVASRATQGLLRRPARRTCPLPRA